MNPLSRFCRWKEKRTRQTEKRAGYKERERMIRRVHSAAAFIHTNRRRRRRVSGGGDRTLCVRVCIHRKRNKLRNFIRRGGVIVCGTPYRRDGSRQGRDGKTGEPARGYERKREFPATRVPVYTYILRCIRDGVAVAFHAFSHALPTLAIHTYKYKHRAHVIPTVILPQQFPRCTRSRCTCIHGHTPAMHPSTLQVKTFLNTAILHDCLHNTISTFMGWIDESKKCVLLFLAIRVVEADSDSISSSFKNKYNKSFKKSCHVKWKGKLNFIIGILQNSEMPIKVGDKIILRIKDVSIKAYIFVFLLFQNVPTFVLLNRLSYTQQGSRLKTPLLQYRRTNKTNADELSANAADPVKSETLCQ
ncbi:hypothetical protein QTP88_018356 [Uroleucon formosanum]